MNSRVKELMCEYLN